ncbi:Gfo/Idh/MocA family oxidoreductase [Brachybacterium sp. MASK1Z-5]|uniref:Gfo/Idh/MocA family oxidoreductase n=1 Tax=Brachybacterium halotolerans TaxID=2795215 RepID=A0ABS1BBB2_9MICO|nr:Gfo/Idh/MocA family oxidoreductase [Brachybacterium halotolerans]MBK0331933.1 Gfo/Idh/MocA family oxidoreductase [Brachybacterium halotolerans]
MPRILNIAVIGAGTMAQAVHLPVLRRRWDRFAVTALVDHSPRRRRESADVWGVEEEHRFETVADLVAAVRAKDVALDAAVLATDGLHVEDLLLLLRRGIPVLVEPPLGYSAQEVARISDFERLVGRRLVMMAYPQQYDEVLDEVVENIRARDVRMIDHEVLMPASGPLFGRAHVTASAYDLPSEKRQERRKTLQEAVVAGAGEGATQRDRDLYVKGLLTGIAHQLAITERIYGPLTELTAVRHWPKGVIPGSLELLGELEDGAPVRLVWHYLPFAPEYSETYEVLSARKRIDLALEPPSFVDSRSRSSLREKEHGRVVVTSRSSDLGAAESMWEAFHEFVDKGKEPHAGAAEALAQVEILREVLKTLVQADGRSLEADPEEEAPDQAEASDRTEVSEQAEDAGATEDTSAAEDADDADADAGADDVADSVAESDGSEAAAGSTASDEDSAAPSAESTSVRIGPLTPVPGTGEIPPAAPTEDLSSAADQLEAARSAQPQATSAGTAASRDDDPHQAAVDTDRAEPADGDAWAAAADDAAKDAATEGEEPPRS